MFDCKKSFWVAKGEIAANKMGTNKKKRKKKERKKIKRKMGLLGLFGFAISDHYQKHFFLQRKKNQMLVKVRKS